MSDFSWYAIFVEIVLVILGAGLIENKQSRKLFFLIVAIVVAIQTCLIP